MYCMGKQNFKSFKGSNIDVDVDVDVNIDIYFTCESRISDSSCLVVAVIVMLVRPPRDRIER